MSRTTVIVLNGVSSVGKSSTARAFQTIAARTFLHVAMDAFLEMLPDGFFGDPRGYWFETEDDGGAPKTLVRVGPECARAMRAMRAAIAAMAGAGHDLIVDDVIFDPADVDDYRRRLAGADLRFVGLFAPLALAEAREKARGDRVPGLARGQHDLVHRGIAYDLAIDTSATTALDNARRIKAAFGL
jgi:chloramphenicol 3-O phosphotransferase